MDSSERVLGRLEAAAETLTKTAARIEAKFDQHAVTDEHAFGSLREGIFELRERLTKLEPIADMIESHETRLHELEEQRTAALSIEENNSRWAKAMLGIGGVAAGVGTASFHERFFKWLGTLFTK